MQVHPILRWVITAHLYLGLRKRGDPGQVLTGADVGVGPCRKHSLQLKQLPSAEGGPLSPVGTQPTGTACRPGWRVKPGLPVRASAPVSKPPVDPEAPTPHPSSACPITPSPRPPPAHPFPPDHLLEMHPLGWSWSRQSEEPDGHAKAVPAPVPSECGVLSRSEAWPRLQEGVNPRRKRSLVGIWVGQPCSSGASPKKLASSPIPHTSNSGSLCLKSCTL